jgi:hypothetical protein
MESSRWAEIDSALYELRSLIEEAASVSAMGAANKLFDAARVARVLASSCDGLARECKKVALSD